MSKVNKVKILTERTSGVPPVIFLFQRVSVQVSVNAKSNYVRDYVNLFQRPFCVIIVTPFALALECDYCHC